MRGHPTRSLAVLLPLLAALLAGPGTAQEETPAAEGAEAAQPEPAPAPEAISLSGVSLAAEDTRKQLVESERALAVPDGVEQVDEDLYRHVLLVQDARRDTRAELADGEAGAKGIADIEREWIVRENALAEWRVQLTSYGSSIDAEIAKLDELAKRWTATRDQESEAESDVVRERAEAMLADIAAVQALARERATDLVGTQDRLAAIDRAIAEALETVREAREETRRQVFESDSQPLWEAIAATSTRDVWQRVFDAQRRNVDSLVSYFALHSEAAVTHLVLMGVLLLVAISLRRQVTTWAKNEPDLEQTARALRDPLSVTLLVGLASSSLFYPLPPTALGDVVGLLLLVPAVRLLPALVGPSLRPAVYGIAGFYLASEVRSLVDAAPLLSRILLAAETGAAIAFLSWLLRPARLAVIEDPTEVPAWLGTLIRAVIALLVVAFVANLTGYTVFARIIATGSLQAAYTAALLYGLFLVAGALLSAGMHTDLCRRSGAVRTGEAAIHRTTSRILRAGFTIWWADMTLGAFGIQEPAYKVLGSIVEAKLELGSVTVSAADVILFFGVIAAAFFVSRFVRFILEEDVFPRIALRRGVSNAISTSANYTILIAGFLLAVAAAGMDLSRLTLLAGAFGVGIGFGLQSVVNNFVSGLILLFERPIQVGDTIELPGLLGDVRRIGARSSTVRTFDGAEVIVPNGMLISDQVINWTLSDRRRRVTVGVGVRYGTDPERVLEILREVASENETVLEDPTPAALFVEFGDSSLDFELRCWIPRYEEGLSIRTALLTGITAKLRAAGIEIPFPQRDLHLRTVDEQAREALGEIAGSAEPDEHGRVWPPAGSGSGSGGAS